MDMLTSHWTPRSRKPRIDDQSHLFLQRGLVFVHVALICGHDHDSHDSHDSRDSHDSHDTVIVMTVATVMTVIQSRTGLSSERSWSTIP